MSNYYAKREAKVNIAIELENRGWKVYGFKEDKSDSMTDYYDPANWNGIATKNGYILVIDDKYASNSGKEITKYNEKGTLSASDNNKIEALKKMTQENGATIGEEENAKSLIEKLESKKENCNGYEVIDKYPEYQANGKGYIWHVEKDGALVDKGNQLTIFSDLPYSWEYDINTMTFKQGYSHKSEYNYETGEYERIERTLSDDTEKAIKAFKTFILRVERAVNGMNTCGDGTKETAEKAAQQESEKMEKVIEKVVKKVVKKVEVERKESLKVNDIFFENGYGYLKVLSIDNTCYNVVKIGKESRGYQESKSVNAKSRWYKSSIDKSVLKGSLKVYILQESEEVQEVEKWVKVKTNNKTTQKTEEVNQESIVNENIEEVEKITTIENTNNTESAINTSVKVIFNEEKSGIELHFSDKPDQEILNSIKANGFRWSKFQKIWYCKDSTEKRNFLTSIGLLNDNSENNESIELKEVVKAEYPEIDINDIESYTIDKKLSQAENNVSMFRKADKDHTKEIQATLQSMNDDVIKLIANGCNDYITYKAKEYLQRAKKKYYDNYVKMLYHKANNPSWAVTGRGNLNVSRYNKKMDQYNKMIQESCTIIDDFNNKIDYFKNQVRKQNQEKFESELNTAIENIDNNQTFEKVKIDINISAVMNIFTPQNNDRMVNVNAYKLNDYTIIKHWGYWRIYDKTGNESKLINRTIKTLEDAKKLCLYLVMEESKNQTAV